MSDRQARGVDRAIQEAEARGEFKDLPGAGKPLKGLNEPLRDDWWLRQHAAREHIGTEALPPQLRLAREVDELEAALDAIGTEEAVRDHLAALNKRIRAALLGPAEGPPLRFGPIDTDTAVQAWRRRRTA